MYPLLPIPELREPSGRSERRVLHREQVCHGGGLRARQVLQRRQVIEDEDAAAVRTDDEVVFAFLDRDVMHRHGRDARAEPRPVRAAVDGEVHAVFRAGEQQVALAMMFAHHLHRTLGRAGRR